MKTFFDKVVVLLLLLLRTILKNADDQDETDAFATT